MRTPDRGERAQVECPECDAWVVLMPSEGAIEGAYQGADAVNPGITDKFESLKVFVGQCPICAVHVTLASVRIGQARPRAEA